MNRRVCTTYLVTVRLSQKYLKIKIEVPIKKAFRRKYIEDLDSNQYMILKELLSSIMNE